MSAEGSKYIKVYDEVIDKSLCDHLINKFHQHEDRWEVHNNSLYTFNQINLPNNLDLYQEENQYLSDMFADMVNRYAYDCGLVEFQFPQNYGFEAIRMKHYPADHGRFNPHIDANNLNTIKRFLVFFLYLNEGEGGETALYDQGIAIPRKPGRLLMFPPMWTYPHAGQMPKGNDKYIIGSYLHYIE